MDQQGTGRTRPAADTGRQPPWPSPEGVGVPVFPESPVFPQRVLGPGTGPGRLIGPGSGAQPVLAAGSGAQPVLSPGSGPQPMLSRPAAEPSRY